MTLLRRLRSILRWGFRRERAEQDLAGPESALLAYGVARRIKAADVAAVMADGFVEVEEAFPSSQTRAP